MVKALVGNCHRKLSIFSFDICADVLRRYRPFTAASKENPFFSVPEL